MTAPCSPWHDNLRHLYEAGRSINTLAHWCGVSNTTIRRQLKIAGTVMRGSWETRRLEAS